MMKEIKTYNKGEWSELYVFLYISENWTLKAFTFNENIEKLEITNKSINVTTIYFQDGDYCTKYFKNDQSLISCINYINNGISNKITTRFLKLKDIIKLKKSVENILFNKPKNINNLCLKTFNRFKQIFKRNSIKASSNNKSDIVLDINEKDNLLQYAFSIKSFLGATHTLLNASNVTNFLYEIKNLSADKIQYFNAKIPNHKNYTIKNKLDEIEKCKAKISFFNFENEVFDSNIKNSTNYIEFNRILGQMLLWSYQNEIKDLSNILKNNIFKNVSNYMIKFLKSVAFDFVPNKLFTKENQSNHGLILIDRCGNIGILKDENNKDTIGKYLLSKSKFDTPSIKWYHMLNIKTTSDNKIIFNLNLQIRLKN